MPVYEQFLRRGLPTRVALEEGPEREQQVAAVGAVVAVERREDAVRERAKRLGILQREQQLIGAEVRELRVRPALGSADLEGVARFTHARPELVERPQGTRPGEHGPAGPGRYLGTQRGEEARPVRLEHEEHDVIPGRGEERSRATAHHGLADGRERLRSLRAGERHHGEGPREIEAEALERRTRLLGREGAPKDLVEDVPLQPTLRLGDRPGLRELEGEERDRVAGHDPVELGEGLLLPDRQERLDPTLRGDGLDRDVLAALHDREAEP